MERNWTPQQVAIFEWFGKPTAKRNALVRARAGTGKTSTIVEALKYAPETLGGRVLLAAFNKRIADELVTKAPRRVDVKTLHALGLATLRQTFGKVGINDRRGRELAEEISGRMAPKEAVGLVAKLASIGKLTLTTTVQGLVKLAGDFDVEPSGRITELPAVDDEYRKEGLGPWTVLRIAELAHKAMKLAAENVSEIDFDDMLWIPAARSLVPPAYDLVVIDEAQDMNAAQLALARAAVRRGGRIAVVGDDRQCIPGDEVVYTPSGPVKMRDIAEGDTVFAPKAGVVVPAKVSKKTATWSPDALRFTLEDGTTFTTTAGHLCFACLGEPNGGYYTYLMHREGMGFRLGITKVSGTLRGSIMVRTSQECADALWMLGWHETREEAALREMELSLLHQVPTVPFKPRAGTSWTNWNTDGLFDRFGQNGRAVLDFCDLSFERPTFRPKASRSQSRVAINIGIGTREGHHVHIESGKVPEHVAERLPMAPTGKGTYRMRRYFKDLRTAERFAVDLAAEVGGYVVRTLYGNGSARRIFEMPASQILKGMLVPVIGDNGDVQLRRVVDRAQVPVGDTYDIEVEGLGTFVVGTARVVVHNCIYSFMGADSIAVDRMKLELDAVEMPLSATFRCPSRVVAMAQVYVPDYRSAPGAAPGVISSLGDVENMPGRVAPGDFVLSRSNAGAAEACLSLLRAGVRATVIGRDVGASLKRLVEGFGVTTLQDLLRAVSKWAELESGKAKASGREEKIERIRDQQETISALCSGLKDVPALLARIDELFADKAAAGRVACSTVHKAKGLEAEQIFVLVPTFRACLDEEEDNLKYVAITRTKNSLVFVGKPPGDKRHPFEDAMRRAGVAA